MDAIGSCGELHLTGGIGLDDDLGETVEEAAVAAFVGLMAAGVTIADADDFAAGD